MLDTFGFQVKNEMFFISTNFEYRDIFHLMHDKLYAYFGNPSVAA